MLAPTRQILPVYAMIDSSNIYFGAHKAAEALGVWCFDIPKLRIDAENFVDLMKFRSVLGDGSTLVTTSHLPDPGFARYFRKSGVKVEIVERGAISGKEQGDDRLLNRMHRLNRRTRGVVALATGDGNGHLNDEGFVPAVEDLHAIGHQIELYSWRHCLNRTLENRVRELGGKVVFLDDYFLSVTFVEGGRRATRIRRK
jgi:hypothetical protein